MKKYLKLSVLFVLLALIAVSPFSHYRLSVKAAAQPVSGYAWGELTGWIDFGVVGYETIVETNRLTGWAWSENLGWISLNCSNDNSCLSHDYGVLRNDTVLSGYAWGEQTGYIHFAPAGGGVTISQDNLFHGYAWGEKAGWIDMGIENYGLAVGSDELSGFAWNDNTGWLSFNCDNESPSCDGTNYGVGLDPDTGHFSGYAWSSNVGWVSFNESNPPDSYAFNTSCKVSGSCLASNNCSACYNPVDNKAYGWAKILSLGADGWIKLNGTWTTGVILNPVSGYFSGWAWNGNDNGSGIGWISFNCSNNNSCAVSDYKVTVNLNRMPQAAGLTAPNWNYFQASITALRANLQFSLVDLNAGSYGSAYQLILKKADDTAVLDTGKCTAYNTPTADCKIDNSICLNNNPEGCIGPADCVCQYALDNTKLAYNTGYKWWVKIWDENDVASPLKQYNTNPDTDNDDGVELTFSTYKHKFPLVSATFLPAAPATGEEVEFTDTSKTFLTAAPTTEVSCNPGLCSWLWTVPEGATIDDPATSTPTIVFSGSGVKSVTLKVTDLIDGYYSSAIIPVSLNADLPEWKEVKPE